MGCVVSSEKAVQEVSSPSQRMKLIRTPQTHLEKDLNFYNQQVKESSTTFYQSIIHSFDSMHESPEKQKQFNDLLSNRIGQMYTQALSNIEDKLIKDQIGVDDLKVNFSKVILLQILSIINKLQVRPNWKTYRVKMFTNIAACQKKIIEFLKFKYPRNKKDFVPTDLENLFYGINDSEHTDYDLLINAGVHFDIQLIKNYERKEVVKQIKKFLNAIINESNRSFEIFREKMENIFSNIEGSFKIGRKISQNVAAYKDINNENLPIDSPQIFRVIIKWISSMEGVFLKTLEKLKDFKYFKILEKNDEEFTYFPLYTGKAAIISSLTNALEPGSKKYKEQQESQQQALANFNDNLAKILTKKTDIPEINQNQIKTIKYAKYICQFVEFLATEKLVYLITELTKLRERMEKKNRKGVDLITCNVSDLLRCRFMGSKNGIMEIFQRMKNLEEDGVIKIVRIKNRFATPLNDTLINFKFVSKETQSFIICQMQLILKKTGGEMKSKFKAYENVNHVLYELERSIFGPMAEMSLLLTHHDTRMGYESKIKLEKNHLSSMRCPENQVLECEYDLTIPYACSLCSKFYPINQNPFPIHRCINCNFYACPRCLFDFDPEMSEECYLKQLQAYIRTNFIPDLEQNEEYGFFFFDKKYLKASEIKRKNKNFFDCLEEKMLQLEQDYAFVFKFNQGKKHLNIYSTVSGELLPVFYDFLPRYERKSFRNERFGLFDIIFFLDSSCVVQKKPVKQSNLVITQLVNVDISFKRIKDIHFFKWQKYLLMIDIGEQLRDNDTTNSSSQNKIGDKEEQFQKVIENYRPRDGQLLLDYMDLKSLHFGDAQINNVRFVKIRSNRLRDLSPLFKHQTLEEIDASRNELQKLRLSMEYKNLRIIDLSENYIEYIDGLKDSCLPNCKQMNLASNNLQSFPSMELGKILWLNLNNNRISRLDEFQRSYIPKLRKLSLSDNSIRHIPEVKMCEILDLQAENNCIDDLNFICQWQKIEQVYLYSNQIKSIPSLKLDMLEKMDLSKNKINDISQLSNSVLNNLRELDLSMNKIKQVPVMEFEELIKLDLSHNQIESINNLYKCQYLVNLETLNLSHNHITESCIFIFEQLLNLNLSHNKIRDLSSLVHSSINKVKEFDFSFNSIVDMPKIQQQELIKLNLQANQITSMDKICQSTLPKMKILNLSHNKIAEFLSAEFPSLEELTLERNQLVKVNDVPEEHLRFLKFLNMNRNKIVELTSMHLESVEKLSINNNNIHHIEQFKFSSLPKLKILDLRFNVLSYFPEMKLDSLEILNLDSNEIIDMTGLSQAYLPNLEQLTLSVNKLIEIKSLRMKKLAFLNFERNNISDIKPLQENVTPQISIINLKKNNLTSICALFSQSLTEVDFSHNKISSINEFFKSDLPKLVQIKLSSNLIEGEIPAVSFPTLKGLDISKNLVNSFEEFGMHSKLPKMDTLKINNNKVEKLGEFKFPKLKDLNMANNALSNIEDFPFSELPKISFINFQNNRIVEMPRFVFNTLVTLNLDNNHIQTLNVEFQRSELPSLERLNLRANRISQWPPSIYFEKLQKLNLSENQLVDFVNINLDTTPELKQLNLKKNKISALHPIELPNMISLNLDNNPLIMESDMKIKQLVGLGESKVNKKLKLTLNKKSSQRETVEQDILKLKEKFSVQ